MKKVLFILACTALLFSVNVFAEDVIIRDEPQEAIENVQEENTAKFTVHVKIGENGNLLPQNFVLGIYSMDKQFWGAKHIFVDTENTSEAITFNIPKKCDKLYINSFSGAEVIEHNGVQYKTGDMIEVENSAEIKIIPMTAQYVKAHANEWELYFKNPAKLINGTAMIPLDEYLTAMSMMHCKTEIGDKTEIEADGHKVEFYLGGNDMYADGNVTYSEAVPVKINEVLYVPVRFLIEGLGGKIIVNDNTDGILDITANYHFSGLKESEFFVKDITSRTNYLIWVSRKDFNVAVFENKNGTWAEQKVFPCSVGAVATPTVTGEFEYFSKENQWSYPTYYVGPIMRFYRGYALHSTLLRYDGSDADARLGKRISHGCVRMKPADIGWMADTIPLYTKVYVTE